MSRLLSIVRLDLRLQLRYGFDYAAAFSALVWIAALGLLPDETLDVAVPFIIFTDLAVVGFYFIAGSVLFEKGERTLYAMVVSPLRFWEYLTSKLGTLTVLAIAVSLVVTAARYGLGFNLPLLALGVTLTSAMLLLVGFISVARFDTISEYLIPSQVYLLPFALPLLDFFGWWHSPILYLIPTQGSLLLLRGAFVPIEAWQVAYAIVYQVVWVLILYRVAGRAFDRYIVARQGGR